jgi:hypothetical protein
MRFFIHPHRVIQLTGLLLTLLAAPIIQFQLNGYNDLVSDNKASAEEALIHDMYYMLKEIGCNNPDIKFATVDCGKGVYQNERLNLALGFEGENSKEVKSLKSMLFYVLIASGYILFLGLYFEFRREYKRDTENDAKQKTNKAIQKEINEWLEIAGCNHDVKVRFKSNN